jgi:hypothetical protein
VKKIPHKTQQHRNCGQHSSGAVALFDPCLQSDFGEMMTIGVAVYYGLDPGIFYRLIRTESSFRSFAISNAQAIVWDR